MITKFKDVFGGSSYSAQLRSEEWRNFSTSIRRIKGNVCEACRLSGKITQVHHINYEPGRRLVEYEPDELMVLCIECHRQIHDELKTFRKTAFRHFGPQPFAALNRALLAGISKNEPLELAYAFLELANDPRLVKNFSQAWTNRKPTK